MTASGTLIALLLRMTALLLLSSAALGTASAAAAAGNWSCAAFNCTCKGMGDYYGVQPGVGFGCAPPPAEEWWNAKKCPVSAGCAAAPGKPCCCTGLGCPAVAPGGGRTCTKSMPCESCTCRPPPPPPLPPCPPIPTPAAHPNWPATWQLNASTVVYACNFSGFFDPHELARFAVVGVDWSNGKAQWSAARPMDDDSRLITQMAMIKAVNPAIKVLGYRNSIQAYNWMSIVREKLDDPQYADWFLQYRDGIDGATKNSSKYGSNPCNGPAGDNTTKCSKFWHFGLTSFSNPCPGGECDCGAAPCASYEFDHRNASFADWFVSEYVMGKLGMGDKNQDGMYFDDGWVGGQPQEVSPSVIVDAGLTRGDIHDIQCAWQQTFAKAQQAIIDAGGWNWQLFKQTANVITTKTTRSACDSFYRTSCAANSTMQTANLYYLFSGSGGGKWFAPTSPFLDIASFLLVRGPYAWIGYAWSQCWGWNGHKGEYFLRPDEFDYDVGAPLGLCHETEPGSSVWTREWSKATATVDCKTMNATIDLNLLAD